MRPRIGVTIRSIALLRSYHCDPKTLPFYTLTQDIARFISLFVPISGNFS